MQKFEDYMLESRAFMRSTDYLTQPEFNVQLRTYMNEIEARVENRMEQVFI